MPDLREEYKKKSRKPTDDDKSEIFRRTILKGAFLQILIFIAIILTYSLDFWNFPPDFQPQLKEKFNYPFGRALFIIIDPWVYDLETTGVVWASWFLFGPYIWYPFFVRGSKKFVSADRKCNSCGALWADYPTGSSKETSTKDYTSSREDTEYQPGSTSYTRKISIREYWVTHYCDYDYLCDFCNNKTIRKGSWDEKINEEVIASGQWQKN